MSTFMKLIIFTACFLLFQVIAYFGVEKFEGRPHDVERQIDKRIPVIPWFSIIYATWFPAIAICPLVLFYADREIYMIYMAAMFLDIILSCITYYFYPTSFTRPETDSWMLKIVYFMSYRQVNCMPSLHCSMSYIIIIACVCAEGLNPLIAAVFIIDSILIPISTLFTKQHVVIDVITAIPYAILCWLAGVALYHTDILNSIFSFL